MIVFWRGRLKNKWIEVIQSDIRNADIADHVRWRIKTKAADPRQEKRQKKKTIFNLLKCKNTNTLIF